MEVWLHLCLLFVAILCINCGRSQKYPEVKDCLPPNIKIQASSDEPLYFIRNTKVEIPCIAQGGGKLTYKWLKNGKELDLNSEDIKDRAAMGSGVGTLVITAQATDEGLYQCSVTNECGTSLSQKTMLTLARMVPFPLLDKPVEVVKFPGEHLILTCNPPESVPKAMITWILTDSQANRNYYDISDDNPGFTTVPLDRRITMDYNGNLHIISVREEDEQGGKIYVCQAENTKTRSTNRGDDKRIIVRDIEQIQDMGVELKWHSDTEALVLEGKTAMFKCIFSGQPEPTIAWEKVVGNIDKNRMVFNEHEMIINNVQYEDAGEYRCMGRNQLSHIYKTHTFTLAVEAAPSWREKPREVKVGVGESAVFVCDATGRPPPTVEWFINGRPYNEVPPNPRRVLKDNTLTFSNLEKDDSQVIQCNATNKHGSLWSDVYLYVQALPPTIEIKPREEVIVAEGQEVRVFCHVTGKPKPSLIWYKGSQNLVHERFQVMDNGDLLIKNTEAQDSGIYKCLAENKFGSAAASGKVTVRGRTRIETKPISAQVDYTNHVTFTCGATTDPMESANLRIRWLKDGVEVKPSDRVMIEGGVLTITKSNSKDTGNYTCIAENGLDSDTAVATLEVKAVPDPPYNVTVKNCYGKNAVIEWKFDEKMHNFDTMIKFIVEYTTEYTAGVWTEMSSVPYPADRASLDLSPFAKYWFRVKAVNKMGTSEPSEATRLWCETPMALPEKNPDNVHTDESQTGYLVIKWNRIEKIDQNGPDFRYVIEVQEQGTEEKQNFTVSDYTITEKKIPVNNIYRPYLIRVRSENQVGRATVEPKTYQGFSGEAKPTVVPENFELDPEVNVTATSAGFRWDRVDESTEKIKGKFSGYKIRFWKVGQKNTTLREQIIETESTNSKRKRRDTNDNKIRAMIANLPSFSDIEADVVVINQNFDSDGSNVVNFSTPEGVPGRVKILEAIVRGSHHFLLDWQKPLEPNGIITGYQLSYRKISRLDLGPLVIAFEHLDPDVNRVSLQGLEPDSQYRIYIRAKSSGGLGEEFFIDVRTISLVSYVALPEIQHVSTGENDANVSWQIPPEKGVRFGQQYYIEYLKKSSNEWVRFEQPIDGQNWSVLKHLEPGTQYQVRLVAMPHSNGEEQPGKPYTFMTGGIGLGGIALAYSDNATFNRQEESTLAGAARASFLTAAWFIGMMVAIAVLILILIVVCIVKRNRGDNYPVQEKERLRGTYNDENQDQFNDYGKGDEDGIKGSGSFDQDAEKVPLDEDADSLEFGDDEGSKFNEDGSFIGQYGRGEKGSETNASSIV